MKKILLIILLLLNFSIDYQLFAQFHHNNEQAELVNIKYLTKDETMKIAKEIGNLTTEQTQYIYLTNLSINRRTLTGVNFKTFSDKKDKVLQKFAKEKELAYKKILSTKQYEKYQYFLRKNESKLVNTNIKIYNNSDLNIISHNEISTH